MEATCNIESAKIMAKTVDTELTIDDFDPTFCVEIESENGNRVFIQAAFVLTWKDYYLLFAEHDEPRVFHKTDVRKLAQYKMLYTKPTLVDEFLTNKIEIRLRLSKGEIK